MHDSIVEKLDKRGITMKHIEECFENGVGQYFLDPNEDHQTDPPTLWFMAPTNRNRILKICFLNRDGYAVIKTAFEPTSKKHLENYRQKAGLPAGWPSEE
jgi:hypothetical protein